MSGAGFFEKKKAKKAVKNFFQTIQDPAVLAQAVAAGYKVGGVTREQWKAFDRLNARL